MNQANFICFVTNLCVALLVGVVLPILPALTRKSYLFGVKIPIEEQGCTEAKLIRSRYITVCMIGIPVIFALIIAQYLILPDLTIVSCLYYPLLFLALQTAAYIPSWKQAVRLKETRGWKVSGAVFAETKSSHSRGNLSELRWVWLVLSLAVILASVVLALIQYPGMPEKIPTHYDFNMQPNVWTDKSLLTVLAMPLINLAMVLVLWLAGGVMIVRAKLQIDPQNPARSFAQHRIYRRRITNSMGFCMFLLTCSLALIGVMLIWPGLSASMWLPLSLMGISLVPVVAISIQSGQGGCRIKVPASALDSDDSEHIQISSDIPGRGDDRCWALGMFYHNQDDPAHIVENRFGNKLGFNYARLPVKIGVAIGLLMLIAMYVWITVLFGSGVFF